ncbi:MAG: hypothetical protein ABIJ09_23980 [Pseudomonadota bacterium]
MSAVRLQLIHYRDDGESGSGKFVLLRHEGAVQLCLAARSLASFHAHIVERYCAEQGVAVTRSDAQGIVIPEPRVQVLGGGRFERDDRLCTLRLYGTSLGYGPFPRDGLRDMLLASAVLPGYTISVEAS